MTMALEARAMHCHPSDEYNVGLPRLPIELARLRLWVLHAE